MLEGLEPPKNRTYYCKVELLRDELEPSDYLILLSAIADTEKWPAKTLQKALAQRKVKLSDTTIGKHRQQVCACFRD
jgi:hypothetical protein